MKLPRTMLLITFGLLPAVSIADLSANVGMVSDYVFRGVFQEDASASAGLDYAHDNGLYVGTWAADVGDGIETDLYFGYGGEAGDFSYAIGYTGYFYSDLFDQTYTELNLSLGYSLLTLDVALGDYDIPDPTGDDYRFTSLTLEIPNGPYLTYGSWGDEFDGDYFEFGYGFEWQGLGLSIALITSDDVQGPTSPLSSIILSEDGDGSAETALVFGFSRSFAVGE